MSIHSEWKWNKPVHVNVATETYNYNGEKKTFSIETVGSLRYRQLKTGNLYSYSYIVIGLSVNGP